MTGAHKISFEGNSGTVRVSFIKVKRAKPLNNPQ